MAERHLLDEVSQCGSIVVGSDGGSAAGSYCVPLPMEGGTAAIAFDSGDGERSIAHIFQLEGGGGRSFPPNLAQIYLRFEEFGFALC